MYFITNFVKYNLFYFFGFDNYKTYLEKSMNSLIKNNILFIKFFQALSSNNSTSNEFKIVSKKYLGDNLVSNDEIDMELLNTIIKKYKITSFNKTPINAGMIAIVFKAELNNKQIVIKLKRKNIEKRIISGFSSLKTIHKRLKNMNSMYSILHIQNKQKDILPILESFINNKQYIIEQCDFENEIDTMKSMKQHIVENVALGNLFLNDIVIPEVYNEPEDTSFIIMEFLDGMKPTEIVELPDKINAMNTITNFVICNLVVFGLFHTDLHPGNIICMKNNKVGIIDFGMFVNINNQYKNALINVIELVLEKTENTDYVECYKYYTEPILDTSILTSEEYTTLNNIVKVMYKELFEGTLTDHKIFELITEINKNKKLLKYTLNMDSIKILLGYTMYCSSLLCFETENSVIIEIQKKMIQYISE